jgi:hypothetical protein
MGILHFVKASDIEFDYCFLEVSRHEGGSPFMDIRISDDREMSFLFTLIKEKYRFLQRSGLRSIKKGKHSTNQK